MRRESVSRALCIAALGFIATSAAAAEDAGWYGGFNVGRSNANIDDARIIRGLMGRGFTTTAINDDDRDTGFKLFGGYQFNRHFGLEGGYFDLGHFGFTATTIPAGTLRGRIRLKGLNLDAVGMWPVTERISVFGRIGLNHAEADVSYAGAGFVAVINPDRSKTDTNYKFGLGLQFEFTQLLAMRVEAERYRIDDAVGNRGDIDLISVGLVYRFGGKQSR